MVTQGQLCECKDWSFDCVFNPQTLSVSIRSRSVADLAMFWGIFVGAEASRMKEMPDKDMQDGYTDNKRYARATDTKVHKV